MNIYRELNECIKYIEGNLDGEINYKHISKIFGCSESTIQRVFSLITGMTLTEYIRRRRLTVAISDIKKNEKIIDIALKYGYSSDVSFSRSFKKMHGILPSKVKGKNVKCNMQPVLKFDEIENNNNLSFRIEELDKFTLYGLKREVEINNVPVTAEKLWNYVKKNYSNFKNATERYGIILENNSKYYYICALKTKTEGFEKIDIPKSKWIVFKGKSFSGNEIKKLSDDVIENYLPNIGLKVKEQFEIEKYNLDYMEIYIMIN